MSKRTKTIHATAVASALALALAAPAAAFAVDTPPEVDPADVTNVVEAGGTADVEITGTVKATTITVSVPTRVSFYIDPGAEQDTALSDPSKNKYGQYLNPTNMTVTNLSAVDVYGYVPKVKSDYVTLTSGSDLEKPGGVAPAANGSTKDRIKVKVGLCDTTETLNLGTANNWLTESVADTPADRYYAFNKDEQGKLTAATANAGTGATVSTNGARTITIRGAVFQGGWSQNESFLIQPTIKIVTDPNLLK